jgi:hypothetical protein
LLLAGYVYAQHTEIIYLSGAGNDNTVNWQFYCTEGRNSGRWTTIPVPSNWELQGFGTYNYGLDNDSVKGREKGLYKYVFNVPEQWKNKKVNIVFEGSMTDTEVKINGHSAGPTHQGSFYCFRYDISKLLEYGNSNLLEVTVAKHSANESVNRAERHADYWIFGGIFRPVYLEALPYEHIAKIAIDARADCSLTANIFLNNIERSDRLKVTVFDSKNQKPIKYLIIKVNPRDSLVYFKTHVPEVKLWSPEFPNLYTLEITLLKNNKPVHTIYEKIGFRTIELRERDGIYLNGVKIRFKGICRHSFWPESGRTLSKTISIKDAEMIKEMNMNAVRNSHYPADRHFYDACDSIGLLILDELAGWHSYYDSAIGAKLVKEMIEFNGNHPSVIIWVNGNEGGHNYALVNVFDKTDIQKRPVIHAWETFRGADTQHYINYDYGAGTHFHGHNVFFPTEFLHGLYDGGHGAGLDDYWTLMLQKPLSAGGFLWDFSDEGVVRTDRNNEIDTDGNHGADGIVGPFRQKEASYYTVKEIWSPIFIEPKEITPAFNGRLLIENRFSFTNTNQCQFSMKLSQIPLPFDKNKHEEIIKTIISPDILPERKGYLTIDLPANWQQYDILYITASDPQGREIYTWSLPVSLPEKIAQRTVSFSGMKSVDVDEDDSLIIVSASDARIIISKNDGLIKEISNLKGIIPLCNGPVLCGGEADFKKITIAEEEKNKHIEYVFGEQSLFKSMKWIFYPSGWAKLDVEYFPESYFSDYLGITFSFSEMDVTGIKWVGDGPYRVWKNRMKGNRLGLWEKSYNNTVTGEKEFIYPEFKGYHSRLYWAVIETHNQPLIIVSANEDIFLRLFTPEPPKTPYNTAPPFPPGDISFLQAIPPIGTKSQIPENMGPSGHRNMYFDYWKVRPKKLTLYFYLSGK